MEHVLGEPEGQEERSPLSVLERLAPLGVRAPPVLEPQEVPQLRPQALDVRGHRDDGLIPVAEDGCGQVRGKGVIVPDLNMDPGVQEGADELSEQRCLGRRPHSFPAAPEAPALG